MISIYDFRHYYVMPHVYNYTMYICDHIITTYVHYILDTYIQHTQTLARRQALHGFALGSLPARDQETSILHSEFVKMFQKVIHHQTRVTSVIFVWW